MQVTIDRILAERQHQVSRASTARMVGVSLALHALLTVVAFWMPRWLAPPPQKFEFVSMIVVPPKALGVEQPPPPTRRTEPKPEPPPPEPEPPPEPTKPEPTKPEPKKPEPKPEPAKPLVPDVPVLPSAKPPAKTEKPKDVTPPPPATAPAAPAKRQGSPFGNPFGSSSSNAVVGVEDPSFTYGYYLDRVVARIESNWIRPPVGSEVKNAHVYFRILRNGQLTDVRLVRTSGSDFFDQAALRAVEASSPLPPLPTSYAKDELGIQLIVK